MTRAVLFDLDRTLSDRDAAFAEFAHAQYDRFGASHFAAAPRERYVERLIALDARGYTPKETVYRTLVAELAPTASEPDLAARLFADFEEKIGDHYRLFPGARALLDQLKADGLALGLVTNGRSAFQTNTIRRLGLADDFAAILISEAEGVKKPAAEIFHRALARLGVSAGEAVFIGDHVEADIRGAKNAGLRAFWKRDPGAPACPDADASFDHLSEVPALLRALG